MADYPERHLGWESIYAYNNEDYGPNSLLGRSSDREVVLVPILRERLERLNPGLPDTAYEDAVRKLTATAASQTLGTANREKHDLIRDGVKVAFPDFKGARVTKRLRVIDFDHPEDNRFLCVRELWIRGDLYRRRADIIGFVNGLPLLFVECKNIHKSLRTAFEDNYSDYRDTIPHIFHHNSIVMRAVREGLDEESLAVFDLLRKPDLNAAEIKAIKKVAVDLLETLKAEKLSVYQWREKESTRDAVKNEILDHLYSDQTGLPAPAYSVTDIATKTEAVFRHIHYAYPRLPSPVYGEHAA